MRVRFTPLLALLLWSGISTGCSLKKPDSADSLDPIEGWLHFSFSEMQADINNPAEPTIMLALKTAKIYPCCNFSIKSELDRSGQNLNWCLLGIQKPEICLTAKGPAAGHDFLDLQEGTYSVNFNKKWSQSDRYVLIVKRDSLELLPAFFSTFTTPDHTVFWRYPRNSFVLLCGTTAETAWIAGEFLSRLRGEIDLEEFKFPDYGEIPYPRSSEGYQNNLAARYFLYQKEEDFDKAGKVLRSYAEGVIAQHDGVGISLRNWIGRYFYSWLFIGG